jgi:hypothetical protein
VRRKNNLTAVAVILASIAVILTQQQPAAGEPAILVQVGTLLSISVPVVAIANIGTILSLLKKM